METNEIKKGRRAVLKFLWVALGIAALVEIAWVIIAYFKPRKKNKLKAASGDIIIAGHIDEFKNDSVTAFKRGRFYLVRLDDGGIMALSRSCTHLGCTVPWVKSEKRFICPCHSSVFNIKGEVIQAPAPRPLDMFIVLIENNIVKVDTSRRIKRDRFKKTQVVFQ